MTAKASGIPIPKPRPRASLFGPETYTVEGVFVGELDAATADNVFEPNITLVRKDPINQIRS